MDTPKMDVQDVHSPFKMVLTCIYMYYITVLILPRHGRDW